MREKYVNWLLKSATKEQKLAWLKTNAIEIPSGCLEWIGMLHNVGYGAVCRHVDKSCYAHRAMYRLAVAEIPAGLYVCHKCDNRKCINPDHLFLATCRENIKDMQTKGRNSWGWVSNEENPNCKYSNEIVSQIRKEYSEGKRYSQIMREYGIPDGTLCSFLNGKSRKVGEAYGKR